MRVGRPTTACRVTARGSGTGLSGACIPRSDGILVSLRAHGGDPRDRHRQPRGRRPARGHAPPARRGPQGPSASCTRCSPARARPASGGNVATNAGGMRAVRYGVTRHQVLGLTAVLGTGEVLRTGGRFVKATSGYDLTQLIIGSEGTLALVTEAILRLHPRLTHGGHRSSSRSPTLDDVAAADPPHRRLRAHAARILEYIDFITMSAITTQRRPRARRPPGGQGRRPRLPGGRAREPRRRARGGGHRRAGRAGRRARRARRLRAAAAAGAALIEAREKAFWTAKANGADDIIDLVVPRASIPEYLDRRCRRSPGHRLADRRLRPRRRRQRAPLRVPARPRVRRR